MYNNNYTTLSMNKTDVTLILQEIGLAPAETTVYMSLLDGAKSVREILKTTDEKRPTVYYSLNVLEHKGLVSKTGAEYGGKFQLTPIETLLTLVDRTILQQQTLLERTKKLIEFYPKTQSGGKVLVSYFDTLDAVKSAVAYSLYAKEKVIRTIVPGKNFFHEMGQPFVHEYVQEKIRRKIRTIALWEDIPNPSVTGGFYSAKDVRQLPIEMHNSFATTTFIYDDKTLYISPKRDCYAVLIQSSEHTNMMRATFDALWSGALKLKD